ncbi:hypothetical protein EDC18_101248 [Natranaerovirga pectinivora]|uniref:Uncharacterized protein n=1 Tax=Natranaerovirga pectinivora TaxID=682400 RepID=A0A4R3MQ14_9FIRM|nr:hypothetical protein [Natranaerovirga pectinivora]TCT16952.1 hypothetical protein EDC18_101248 [Natranaerovirga pectinivora]
MMKKVGGLILICISIGMFLMLFIPKGLLTVLAILGLIYIGYRFITDC